MTHYSVLIADDDAHIRKILARICQKFDWQIDEAENGVTAVEKLDTNNYQIYVLDVKMPGPSGLELAKIILEKHPAAAILILTGYAELEQAIQSIKCGVFDYIQKDNVDNALLEQHLTRAAEYHDRRLEQMQAQKEREESLKDIERSNKEFQAILELSNDLIMIANAKNGELTDSNKTVGDKLGYSRTELLSLSLIDIFDDLNNLEWDQAIHSIQKQLNRAFEAQIITKNQRKFYADITYAHVCLDTGEYIAIIARDITERKQAEYEIARQRENAATQAAILHTIIESIDEGILLADANGMISEVNNWFINFAQTPKEFLIHQHVEKMIQLITGCDITSTLYDFKSQESMEKISFFVEMSEKRLMLTLQPIFEENKYAGAIVKLTDITDLISEQMRAEDEINYNREYLMNTAKELHAPIEGIAALSSQLADTRLDESQRILLQTIQDFSRTLSNLLKQNRKGIP